MTLIEARKYLREVSGRPRWWIEEWGASIIREALRTIRARVSATPEDLQLVEEISLELNYGDKRR